MSTTDRLVTFAHDVQLSDVPDDVLDKLAVLVADSLAAGIIGARQPWHGMVLSTTERLSSGQPARGSSLFGSGSRLDPSRAALVNGVAISGFEFEHAHEGGHPGATVLPAVLAIAQERRVPAPTVIRALIAGYELNVRIGLGLTGDAERKRGFHRPAIGGVLGSAIGCSVVLDLPKSQLTNAVGVAGSHACGLIAFVQNGAMTKRLHLGRATQLGLESALLAEAGFTGPDDVIDGPFGVLSAYSPNPSPEEILADLGSYWQFADSLVKQYNAHGECQSAVAATRTLALSGEVDIDAIEKIVLRTSSNGGEARYHTTSGSTALDAQYSLPLMIALSLLVETRSTDEFWTLIQKDPRVTRLAKLVEIEADGARFGVRAIVGGGELEIHEKGGKVHRFTQPGRPLPEPTAKSREIVIDKLESARPGVSADTGDAKFVAVADAILQQKVTLTEAIHDLVTS